MELCEQYWGITWDNFGETLEPHDDYSMTTGRAYFCPVVSIFCRSNVLFVLHCISLTLEEEVTYLRPEIAPAVLNRVVGIKRQSGFERGRGNTHTAQVTLRAE